MDQLDLDRELDALYAAISGRRFSYDPYSDPLYRSYAARYVQNGRMAMRDTMGQAAALTGGYASSYGQAVGQQQYDEYLRALSEAMPELYQMAYQRYSAEGEALRGAYDMANARRESDYARERDAAADAAARDERDYKRRQDAYARLYQLILGSGYDPSDEELEAAGLSRAQADALLEVKAGTSDACVIDLLMAVAMVGEGTSYADLTYTFSLNEEQYGVAFRQGSDLTEALNAFLAEQFKAGALDKLADTYGLTGSVIAQ